LLKKDDCDLFFENVNLKHKNIKFTMEIENNDNLPFLDVMVSRSEDGILSTSLYRKDTFSGLYLKFDSFVPHHFKRNIVFGLLNRAWKICTSQKIFNTELNQIKRLLRLNGFPTKFLNREIRKFLRKKENSELRFPFCGPERRALFIMLPFCGQNSLKLQRQLKRIIGAVAPWPKLNIIFKPSLRLNTLSKLKSIIPVLNRSNVIYRINCNDCVDFYIG
jgi:hypothetical protein